MKKYSVNPDDKKEQLLYRIVRILFIFAIVIIIGLKFASADKTNGIFYHEGETEQTDIETLVEQTDTSTFEGEAIVGESDSLVVENETIAEETEIIEQIEQTDQEVSEVQTEPEETIGQAELVETENISESVSEIQYQFRNKGLLDQHYKKHGIEMGFASAEEYEVAASAVVNNPKALHKLEAEDGDDVYYVEDTNEFVIVSKDGYLRTYFYPNAGKSYYERQ